MSDDIKDNQPESKPEQTKRPKAETVVKGQMLTHPSNPLYRFPTDDNLKTVMDALNEDSKTHFAGGKVSRDAAHKCPDEGNCELCWSVEAAAESKVLDKYIQVAAVEMLGPMVVMFPFPRVWAFAFFCFILGQKTERRDRDQAELAQLEKLMLASGSEN